MRGHPIDDEICKGGQGCLTLERRYLDSLERSSRVADVNQTEKRKH